MKARFSVTFTEEKIAGKVNHVSGGSFPPRLNVRTDCNNIACQVLACGLSLRLLHFPSFNVTEVCKL